MLHFFILFWFIQPTYSIATLGSIRGPALLLSSKYVHKMMIPAEDCKQFSLCVNYQTPEYFVEEKEGRKYKAFLISHLKEEKKITQSIKNYTMKKKNALLKTGLTGRQTPDSK